MIDRAVVNTHPARLVVAVAAVVASVIGIIVVKDALPPSREFAKRDYTVRLVNDIAAILRRRVGDGVPNWNSLADAMRECEELFSDEPLIESAVTAALREEDDYGRRLVLVRFGEWKAAVRNLGDNGIDEGGSGDDTEAYIIDIPR